MRPGSSKGLCESLRLEGSEIQGEGESRVNKMYLPL